MSDIPEDAPNPPGLPTVHAIPKEAVDAWIALPPETPVRALTKGDLDRLFGVFNSLINAQAALQETITLMSEDNMDDARVHFVAARANLIHSNNYLAHLMTPLMAETAGVEAVAQPGEED